MTPAMYGPHDNTDPAALLCVLVHALLFSDSRRRLKDPILEYRSGRSCNDWAAAFLSTHSHTAIMMMTWEGKRIVHQDCSLTLTPTM